MVRGAAFAILLLMACAGCGEPPRARVVPVTSGASSGVDEPAAGAVTKPARAIATH
jgi:hypothetical protein